jgi:FkbM family methyltransferase
MGIISFSKKLLKRDHTYVADNSIQWLGTEYGGFYLDKSLLGTSSNLFSFGVGEDISFDLSVSKLGIQRIYLFDPTPKSIDFIKGMNLPENFQFYPVGISDKDEYADFFLPKNVNNVSGGLSVHKQLDAKKIIRVQLKRLFTIIKELDVQRIDVLKMDIEGSEYKVLKGILLEKIFPVQICVEFHNSFYKNGKKLFKDILNLLKENDYEVGAVSKSGNEYLFIKNQK